MYEGQGLRASCLRVADPVGNLPNPDTILQNNSDSDPTLFGGN